MKTTHLPSTQSTQKENTVPKSCYFCNAEEGKVRKIGQFEVALRTVTYNGELKMACQSCARKAIPSELLQDKATHRTSTLKKMFSGFVTAGFVLLIFSSLAIAQPPGFPSQAEQAPIDGGLSLLAAAGGAYAIKKLRDKKPD